MATHTFTWYDGTKLDFEDFDIEPGHLIVCNLPSLDDHYYNPRVYVYINEQDYKDWAGGQRYVGSKVNNAVRPPDPNKIRVGVLQTSTKHGFPMGSYIPFKFTNSQNATNAMDGLYGDCIIHPKHSKKAAASIEKV